MVSFLKSRSVVLCMSRFHRLGENGKQKVSILIIKHDFGDNSCPTVSVVGCRLSVFHLSQMSGVILFLLNETVLYDYVNSRYCD